MLLVDLGNDFNSAKFSNLEDRYYALFRGPWMVADYYLIVHQWRHPNCDPYEATIDKVAVCKGGSGLLLKMFKLSFRLNFQNLTTKDISQLRSAQTILDFVKHHRESCSPLTL
jgi:hypothetical protein